MCSITWRTALRKIRVQDRVFLVLKTRVSRLVFQIIIKVLNCPKVKPGGDCPYPNNYRKNIYSGPEQNWNTPKNRRLFQFCSVPALFWGGIRALSKKNEECDEFFFPQRCTMHLGGVGMGIKILPQQNCSGPEQNWDTPKTPSVPVLFRSSILLSQNNYSPE